MGFVYECAAAEHADLLRAAEAAAPALLQASFSTALESDFGLPGPTAKDRVVVLGIGGSALGARCVHAVTRGASTPPLVVVDNIDPDAFEEAWSGGDPRRTAWVVVSKSGETTEPLTQFQELKRRMEGAGEVHVVTGARGSLREQAKADGLPVFEVPEDVGGRFSVFTPAATVALALAGHDVAALLDGARAARGHCARAGGVAARIAALTVAAGREGRNVVTLWSYAERLESAGEWFRQLWGESLGKQGRGQTPVHCVGSTDQHSMQQLMVEGPADKAVLVLAGPAGATEMDRILHAMRRATSAAMARAGHPVATIRLDDWREASIGAVLMTLLCATVLAGKLMDVDPYGQPGVEASKRDAKELLASPGGEADAEIARLLGEDRGLRCP